MSEWQPISTLAERKSCTDYLVLAYGRPRLLWWSDEDGVWLGDSDREDDIPEAAVTHWFQLPPAPTASLGAEGG